MEHELFTNGSEEREARIAKLEARPDSIRSDDFENFWSYLPGGGNRKEISEGLFDLREAYDENPIDLMRIEAYDSRLARFKFLLDMDRVILSLGHGPSEIETRIEEIHRPFVEGSRDLFVEYAANHKKGVLGANEDPRMERLLDEKNSSVLKIHRDPFIKDLYLGLRVMGYSHREIVSGCASC